jgi:predicted dehydrogenase
VDPSLLAAGDHNGSTFFQHQGFGRTVTGGQKPDVTLDDGWWAVAIGLAAQQSAVTGQAVSLRDAGNTP